MSGQADALAVPTDRRQFTTPTALRKLPSAGGPSSPLDFYLSWMSPPDFPPDHLRFTVLPLRHASSPFLESRNHTCWCADFGGQVKRKRPGERELWKALSRQRFWQRRYYDFNVYSEKKIGEKLHYMHWNPVRRGFVSAPELWHWSSSRAYAGLEPGAVKLYRQSTQVNTDAKPKTNGRTADSLVAHPPKIAEGRAPTSSGELEKAKAHNVN